MIRAGLSRATQTDIDAILDYYISHAGDEVALGFIAAWQAALRRIEENPDIGSKRLAKPGQMENLRVWPIRGFPHLVLYRRGDTDLTILRVLHAARDIPRSLQD